MTTFQSHPVSPWDGPLSHLEPCHTTAMCAFCPLSQDPSRKCPDGCAIIADLVFLRRHLAEHRKSAAWNQASRMAGTGVSALAASLISAEDSTLPRRILDRFCPSRLWTTGQAATRFRDIDLAIRAVPAAAVLHRFGECLDYVHRLRDPARWRLVTREFSPNDLLARMANLAACSQPRWNSGRSHLYYDAPLFSLVLNETMWRLGMALPNRRLVKRVHKHMGVCLSVANITMTNNAKSEQEGHVVRPGLRGIPVSFQRPRARSLLVGQWQGE